MTDTERTLISYDSVLMGSKFHVLEGANPKLVYQLFQCELIYNLYPSDNLHELKDFPENFKKSVKYFKTKILKDPAKKIYMKFINTVPEWIKDKYYLLIILLPLELQDNKHKFSLLKRENQDLKTLNYYMKK